MKKVFLIFILFCGVFICKDIYADNFTGDWKLFVGVNGVENSENDISMGLTILKIRDFYDVKVITPQLPGAADMKMDSRQYSDVINGLNYLKSEYPGKYILSDDGKSIDNLNGSVSLQYKKSGNMLYAKNLGCFKHGKPKLAPLVVNTPKSSVTSSEKHANKSKDDETKVFTIGEPEEEKVTASDENNEIVQEQGKQFNCGDKDKLIGNIIFCDDFSWDTLDSDKWKSGGNSVTQSDGILTLSDDVTDQTGWISTQKLDVTEITIHLRHRMQAANEYFFPSITLRDKNEKRIVSMVFLKSAYAPDYCSIPEQFNKVLLRTESDNCVVVGEANSSDYYDRWIETFMSYDSKTGNIIVDLDADGTIDATYKIPVSDRKIVHDVRIEGYGWHTGHLHELDYIVIGTKTLHAGAKK